MLSDQLLVKLPPPDEGEYHREVKDIMPSTKNASMERTSIFMKAEKSAGKRMKKGITNVLISDSTGALKQKI